MKNLQLPTERLYSSAFRERGQADIVKWEVLPISNGESLKLKFESVSSPWRQGVWIKTDEGMIINDVIYSSVELWANTAPTEVVFTCKTKDGRLHIYNIWDKGHGKESQAWTSGMKIEVLTNARRFFCNDIGFETDFRKLVFCIEKLM